MFFSDFRVFWVRLATLPTIRPPTQKSVTTPLYVTHMMHSNPPSVQSKQRTGRCFDVAVVLRHRREILHFKINEL